jgi:hypothetical protein
MIKNKLKILLVALMTIPIFAMTGAVASAAYNPLNTACQGQAAASPVCKDAKTKGGTNPVAGPDGIISKAANIIALVTGIGAVIMILIGGFEYVTSGGVSAGQRGSDPNKVKQARARIVGALIGLVVVALAWTIVRLVTDKVLK